MVRGVDEYGQFLHRKEGGNQGDILSMIAYYIGILPLICEIRAVHPHITHPWFTCDAGAGGKSTALQDHMRDLVVRGPPWGYFPETTNRILVVSLRNVPREES